MSASDTIALVQTGIALFTCVLLLWYIIATHKLQRHAQDHSRLQMEQLAVAKQQLEQVLVRERLLFRPDLRWRGGFSANNEERWDFDNFGADICNLRWAAPEGISLDCEPRCLIRTFDRGSIHLRAKEKPLIFPLRFSLIHNNRFGETCKVVYDISGAGAEPREVEST